MGTTNLIEIKNVKKQFPTAAGTVEVLHDVSFAIPEGSFTIIYGPSGSGKSTLLNTLIGLDAPTNGTVMYGGKDLYSLNADELAYYRANSMGLVQQSNYWVKSLTVLENVAMSLYFLGMSKEKAEQEALNSLKRVHMEQTANSYPTVLSGGEQQRVAMARALVNNPSYIVADEPTGNLDSKNGDMIIDLLRYFNQELQRTIVLVTHNLEYLPLGNKLLFIQDGYVTETEGKDIEAVTDKLLGDMQKRIKTLASIHAK
jgi:putative ABC transport system ATP-binding protein